MRLKQLLERRAGLVQEANTALDAATALAEKEGRSLSDAELTPQKAFDATIAGLDRDIAAERSRMDRAAPAPTPIMDAGPVASRIEVGPPNLTRDPKRGFFNFGDFGKAVYEFCRPGGGSVIDRRLIEGGLLGGFLAAGLLVGSASAGPMAAPTNYHQETATPEGAMVPPDFRQAIWQLVFNDPLLAKFPLEPTNSNQVDLLADESTPWGATGVQATWRAEGVQMVASKLVTGNRSVRVHELYAFVLATGELLDDAPRLNDRLNTKVPAAIRWKLIEAFVSGTGAGQPLGFLNAAYAGGIIVNRAGGANTITTPDIGAMERRLLVTDGPDNSFWVTNRDTLPQLLAMTVANNAVFLSGNSLAGRPIATLLGRELLFSDHASSLGTKGDLMLVNPDGYFAIQRGPSQSDSSIHLFFDYNITAFRTMFRFGGQPLLSAAVTPAKGSSRSHYVILN
jgi:HK97 family phage major capsid protein